MASYLVIPDDYAGWSPTGRNFALISAAIGALGLLSWMSLHRHLGAFRPAAPSDQLFLSSLVWFGAGGFCLMAFAAMGSILLSLRSRGTVTVTAEGVVRTVNARTRSLAWSEIQGLVPMPYGGVTLVAATADCDIVIPRFLDDYRACIAELKDHGVRTIPASSLRRKSKSNWRDTARLVCFIFFYSLATGPYESHRLRIASFSASTALALWLLQNDWAKADLTTPRWFTLVVFLGILLFGLWRMAHSW